MRGPPPPVRATPTTISPRSTPTRAPRVPPPARATPTATSPRSIPTPAPRVPPPVRAMPTTITAPGTATIMQAGARPAWARVTRAGSGPGASARRCTAGAIRAIAIPTLAAVSGAGGVAQTAPVQQHDRGAGFRLLAADQHDRRAARAGRRQPGECGVRPGPRGVQGGRLRPGRSARPAGARPDAQ